MIKGYMELYEGKLHKRKVEYKDYKNSTHAVMCLILFASLAFNIALWDAYGGFKTVFIMTLFGYGVLLQLALLFPTWLQNMVTFVGLTYFIQMYQ